MFLAFGYLFSSHLMPNKPLMESLFLAENQVLSIWSGDADSKTLNYQRTPNPMEYQIVPNKGNHLYTGLGITLCRTPHPNNKEDKNTNPTFSIQDCHLTQPSPSEENKQANFTFFHQNTSTNHTIHEPYTNQRTNLMRAQTKMKNKFNPEAQEK